MALATIFPLKASKGPIFNQQKLNDSLPTDLTDGRKDLQEAFAGAFAVQAAINETYDFTAEVSDNPVESGIDVTDNINVRPLEIVLTMKQSDTPIDLNSVLRGAAVSAGSLIGKNLGGPIGQVAGGVSAGAYAGLLQNGGAKRGLSKTAYDQFRSYVEGKAILTVQTGLDLFKNMAITSLQVTRNQQTGRSIDFTVRLRQVRVVTSSIENLPVIPERKVSDQASNRSGLGKQAAKETASTRKSVLKNFSNVIFGG
jgi:uncharacterized membrane protein